VAADSVEVKTDLQPAVGAAQHQAKQSERARRFMRAVLGQQKALFSTYIAHKTG
jgi:hypothetical protein